MSYRGFATKRHYYNAKIHAFAEMIGDEGLLERELKLVFEFDESKELRVSALSDTQAAEMFKRLISIYKKVNENEREIDRILGTGKYMTDGQKAAIIKLTKYTFNWKPEATFSFILETCPELRDRMSKWEIQKSQLKKLYLVLRKKQADRVIKRLDQIKYRNATQQKIKN